MLGPPLLVAVLSDVSSAVLSANITSYTEDTKVLQAVMKSKDIIKLQKHRMLMVGYFMLEEYHIFTKSFYDHTDTSRFSG